MISRFVLIVFALLAWNLGKAQTSSPADTLQTGVHADPRLKVLVSKHNDVLKRGQAQGYRVQIYFGTDKTKAKEMKSRFLASYASEAKAYEIYEQPNFKIRVGDFRSRLEAYRFLKKIRADFPASFIVGSKIEMPSVK
jgi:hypothetical protein